MVLHNSEDKVSAYFVLAIVCFFVGTFHYGTTQILLSGILLCGLIVLRHQRFSYRNDIVWWMFVSYFIYGVVATCGKGQLDRAVYYYILPLVSYILGTLVPVYREKYEFIIIFFVMTVLAYLTFLMFFQVKGGGFDVTFEYMVSRSRGESYILHDENVFIGSTVIAPMLSMVILSAVFFCINSKVVFLKLVGALLSIYGVGLQVFAGSRTGVVSVLIIILAVGWFSIQRPSAARYLKIVLVILALIAFVMIVLSYSIASSDDAYYRFSRMTEVKADNSLMIRFGLWQDAIELFDKGVLGYGPTFFLEKTGYSTHNEALGVLVSLGLPGLILWGGAHIAILHRIFSNRFRYGRSFGFYVGLLMAMFFSSLTENYSMSGAFFISPIFFLCLGMATNVSCRK